VALARERFTVEIWMSAFVAKPVDCAEFLPSGS
jgi:hypothetical protein